MKKLTNFFIFIFFIFVMPQIVKGIDITDCTDITESGTYYLIQDINESSPNFKSYCINISANNVTLDCQWHSIQGNDTKDCGIYIYRSSNQNTNITIKNCNVTHWKGEANIYLENASNNTLENINSFYSSGDGFEFRNSHNNTIINSTAALNHWCGFYFAGSSFNVITNSVANSNFYGFNFLLAHNNKIVNSTAKSSSVYGFIFYSSNSNILTHSIAKNNEYGLKFYRDSDYNIVNFSVFQDNLETGLILENTTTEYPEYNYIYNCLFNNSGTYGNFRIDTEIPNPNYFNTTKQEGFRIYSAGNYIGGNYYTNSTGNGFSDTCTDSDQDGFCDKVYDLYNDTWCELGVNCSNQVDYLPLSDSLISDCTDITKPGEYHLIADINSSSPNIRDKCIIIQANNVTLDCQGHKIDANGTEAMYGIYVSRSTNQNTNITIKNCEVTNWKIMGIYFSNASNNILENIVSSGSEYFGFYFRFSNNNKLNNIVANINGYGIEFFKSNDNNLANITVNSNIFIGLNFRDSKSNNLYNVTANNNKYGIMIYGDSDDNEVRFSKFQNNSEAGCYIENESSKYPEYNCIWNSLFNNSKNCYISSAILNPNYFSWPSIGFGVRIYSKGRYVGGNYWTNPSGNGYSDTCIDSDYDGFCDSSYDVEHNDSSCSDTYNCDHFPLSNKARPVINSYQILPRIGEGENITINANVTSESTNIIYVNFTLIAPNGTKVIDNENGIHYNNDLWNSSYYVLDDYGTWIINIAVEDDFGTIISANSTFEVTLGNFSVLSPDNDKDWTFSLNKTKSEVFNLTLSTDGNSNNTIDFYVTGDLNNTTICNVTFEYDPYTLEYNSTKKIWVNITTSSSSPTGTYSGYIVANRTNDNYQDNISITFTITSLGAGEVDIINNTFTISGETSNQYTRVFLVNNTGTYNLTNCAMFLSTSIESSVYFNDSNFLVEPSQVKAIKMTFDPAEGGADSEAVLSVVCTATAEGGQSQDSIIGAIAITQKIVTGGGGGGSEIGVCGDGICSEGEDEVSCPIDCANLTFAINPALYEIGLDPDSSKIIDFLVTNPNDYKIRVLVYFDGYIKKWFRFLDDSDIKTIELLPKESKEVKVKIMVPYDAEKKVYEGLVIFAMGQQKRAAKVKVYVGAVNIIDYVVDTFNSLISMSPNGIGIGSKFLPSNNFLALSILSLVIFIILIYSLRSKKKSKKAFNKNI